MSDSSVDRRRLIFPGLAGLYEKFSPASYSLMRFATGAVLLPHGIQKIFFKSVDFYAGFIGKAGLPFPTFLAYCTFFSESVAALCLVIGLFTRAAALIVWIQMTVIIIFFQWQYGYFWTDRGFEYALLWWLLCLAIIFRGGGRYSVDHHMKKEF